MPDYLYERYKADLNDFKVEYTEKLKSYPELETLATALDAISKDDFTSIKKPDSLLINGLYVFLELPEHQNRADLEKIIINKLNKFSKLLITPALQNARKALTNFIITRPIDESLSHETREIIAAHNQLHIKDMVSEQKHEGGIELSLEAAITNPIDINEARSDLEKKVRARQTLTTPQTELLGRINQLAVDEELRLADQSDAALNILLKQINENAPKAPIEIYNLVKTTIEKENTEARQKAARSARNTTVPLHKANLHSEMHDQDITAIMPKSFGAIEVLASLNLSDPQSTALFQESLEALINDNQINHIFVPVGPGHWRGFYLSKPKDGSEPYQLELFDSCGTEGAKSIQTQIEALLTIAPVNITLTEPPVKQTEGYSCGDYVCAYSHQKMQEIHPDAPVNEKLIFALKQGNQNDHLRKATRKVSKEKANQKAPAPTRTPTSTPALPVSNFPNRTLFLSQLDTCPVKNGWHLALDPNHQAANQYIIQSIDETGKAHRTRDVTVAPGKVSAVLSVNERNPNYKKELAAVMVHAAIISGIPLEKIQINCANLEMNQVLREEIEHRKAAPLSTIEEEIVLRPGP